MKPHKTLWEDQIQNAVWCGLNAVWWTFLSSNPLSALRCHLFLHRSFLGMALVLVWGLLWRGFGAILSPVIHTEVTILTIPYFIFYTFQAILDEKWIYRWTIHVFLFSKCHFSFGWRFLPSIRGRHWGIFPNIWNSQDPIFEHHTLTPVNGDNNDNDKDKDDNDDNDDHDDDENDADDNGIISNFLSFSSSPKWEWNSWRYTFEETGNF